MSRIKKNSSRTFVRLSSADWINSLGFISTSVTGIHILLSHILTFTPRHLCFPFGISPTKPRFIASARMSYFRSVRDHSWVHDSRKSTSPNSQAIPPRRTTRGWVWRLMRETRGTKAWNQWGTKELPHQTYPHLGKGNEPRWGSPPTFRYLEGPRSLRSIILSLFPLDFLSSLAIHKTS